ncbi:MAG TPA: hypothetical protein PLZ84_09085 [Clostridia bacterium]|nr:hypothetical protein [Clostridia bacterium]
MIITVERVNFGDLPALADLYYELSGQKTDMAIMQESFEKINSDPSYILLAAKMKKANCLGRIWA